MLRSRKGQPAETGRKFESAPHRCPAVHDRTPHFARNLGVSRDHATAGRQRGQLLPRARQAPGGGCAAPARVRPRVLEPRLQRRSRDVVEHRLHALLAPEHGGGLSERLQVGHRHVLRGARTRQRRPPERRLRRRPVQRRGRPVRQLRREIRRRTDRRRKISGKRLQPSADLPDRRTDPGRGRQVRSRARPSDRSRRRVLRADAGKSRELL